MSSLSNAINKILTEHETKLDKKDVTIPTKGESVKTPEATMTPDGAKRPADKTVNIEAKKDTEAKPEATKALGEDDENDEGEDKIEDVVKEAQIKKDIEDELKKDAPKEKVVDDETKDAMKKVLDKNIDDVEMVKEALDIFEAAVETAVDKKTDEIVDTATKIVKQKVDDEVDVIEEQIDDYLSVAIAEWAEDNRLAVESGIRTNIAESFMADMKGLLESYNITIPDAKVDLYEKALEKGQELLDQNEELKQKNAEQAAELKDIEKKATLESFIRTNKLSLAEAERLRDVSERLTFTESINFTNKLVMLSEADTTPDDLDKEDGDAEPKTKTKPKSTSVNDDGVDGDKKDDVPVDTAVAKLAESFYG